MNFIPPLWIRPLIAADSFAFYLYKLIFPWNLALDYGRSPQWVLENRFHYWTWIAPFLGSIFTAFLIKRHKGLAAGLLIFSIGILPISGLVPFEFQEHSSVSDHYLYLPLFGLSLFLALLQTEFKVSKWIPLCCLVILGMKSVIQLFYWKDNETLFRHNLEINPRSDLAYFTLAKPRFERQQYEECIQLIQASLFYNPNDVQGNMVIGASLIQLGRKQEAIDYYLSTLKKPLNTAGKRAPIVAAIHSNLGTALHQTGRTLEAVEQFNKALEIDPDHINAHVNLGVLQEASGNFDGAIQHFQKALALSPDNSTIKSRLNQAMALKQR